MKEQHPSSTQEDDGNDGTVVIDVVTETTLEIPGYEMIETLGRGGMGMVYRARQTDMLDREVALKTILPRHEDMMFRRYFLKEGQRQAQLHHPNILPIFTAGEAGQVLYLSMYYARDGSLRDRIDGASLTVEQSVDIVCSVLAALHHAHKDLDAPLAHLDVKPENILFDGENVFLADFGIAKTLAEDATVIEGAAGDPRYWPPEQRNNEASTKSDIYALGIMFFEMLSGQRPSAAVRTISNRTQAKALAAELPQGAKKFAPLIAQCLQADPQGRPDADTMRRELKTLIAPRRFSVTIVAAGLVVLALAIALSQPIVHESFRDGWTTLFPPESRLMTFSLAPANGQLWIDGQEEALRSLSLAEGEHRVVAVADGYIGESSLINVGEDPTAVAFELQPVPAADDDEYQRFINSFDGSDQVHTMDWNDPTLLNLAILDRLESDNPGLFRDRINELRALATAGDAVAATSLFYAAFEGLKITGGPKPLVPGLINASEDGYALASLLRALYVIQTLFEAKQTFNDNPYAFEEVEALLERAANQGLAQAAAWVGEVAGVRQPEGAKAGGRSGVASPAQPTERTHQQP